MDGKAPVDDARRARALIVGDDSNKLHLIAPKAAIVDLTVLNQWSGRQLRTESFEPISAIPGSYEHPIVVDRRVAEWEYLALATEQPDEYVTLTHAEFERDAARGSISAAIRRRRSRATIARPSLRASLRLRNCASASASIKR
jgi:hypothetical protein